GGQMGRRGLAQEGAEGTEGLLERRVLVVAVNLVEIDPIGAQPPEPLLHLQEDVPTRRAAVEYAARARHEYLGRDHCFLASALECLADDLLGLAHAVAVGGVDEGDTLVESATNDANAVGVILVAPATEGHGAEAEARDLEAAVAELRIVHAGESRPNQPPAAIPCSGSSPGNGRAARPGARSPARAKKVAHLLTSSPTGAQ